ncbi:hypothetical protein M728_000350 [Ensifer sp. WSM1721]|uniref:hypothetical protein n=1 Tax=Ensifer sp. WSM1721 TaxID=1041159 RepID=UPI00047E7377|nr:hypothetical protein [Ensifer sp. WSM1721]
MSTAIRLLSCPFCCAPAHAYNAFPAFEHGWTISCEHTDDCVLYGTHNAMPCEATAEKIAASWNRRDFSPGTIATSVIAAVSATAQPPVDTASPQLHAQALDWSNFEGPKRNVDWRPDDQELIYTAINYRDDEYGDQDEDAGQQIVERLLAAWQRERDFTHRIIENAFSWALKDCNYLNPKYMERLIAETYQGMKPEQAAIWNATVPERAGRNGEV